MVVWTSLVKNQSGSSFRDAVRTNGSHGSDGNWFVLDVVLAGCCTFAMAVLDHQQVL
jgi:hypothetical protein